MLAGEREGLGEVLHLRHALYAARAARVDRLDDEVAPALDGDALKLLHRRHRREPRDRHAGRQEAFLHRELVAGETRAFCREAGQAEAFGDGGRRLRRIRGDTDHAIDFSNLPAVAFGGGGGFLRAIDVGDQARIRVGETGCFVVAVGDDDVKAHFLRALGRVGRFDPAGDDEECLLHQK